jgi:serine/threonine protein kinase
MSILTNLGRYRYISALGAGGMSTVALAEDTVLGRRVALKRMTAEDDRGLLRLRREALIGASVSHPNLVSIFDIVSTEEGDDVIVMEYVDGVTLRELMRREPRIPLNRALAIRRRQTKQHPARTGWGGQAGRPGDCVGLRPDAHHH